MTTAPPTPTPPAGPPAVVLPPMPMPARPAPPAAFWPGWIGPKNPPGAAALAAMAGGAAFAAITLPVDRPGLGWLLAAVAGAAAVAVAVGRPESRRPGFVAWTVATILLLGVGTFRAAEWLFALCALAAGVTAALALVDARSARAMLLGLLAPIPATMRALPWTYRGVRALQRRNGNRQAVRALAVAAVSVVLLLVFGALFASADLAFGELVERVVPAVSGSFVARLLVLFPALVVALAGAAFLRAAPPSLAKLTGPARRHFRALEWAVPVGLLVLLFLMFVIVQLTVLFGGTRHVLGPDGPTFAEYARGGFWQLLVVTGLTLLVIAAAGRWAPRQASGERVLIRTLLGALAALTLVIVASALYRMHVYQQAYGYTRLRVFVFAVEIALGVLFLLVIAAGVRLRTGWLARAVVAVGVLTLLGLAVLNPDRFVADRNIDRFQTSGRLDVRYLSTLSADAAPALDRLTGDQRSCALSTRWVALANRPDGWRDLNVARERARDLLIARPPGSCRNGSD
jgi:hypothetical protein